MLSVPGQNEQPGDYSLIIYTGGLYTTKRMCIMRFFLKHN